MSPNCRATTAPQSIDFDPWFFLSALRAVCKPPESKPLYVVPLQGSVSSRARCPFSRSPSEPGARSSSSHSVPSMQFQVLLTCLSAFFSTFLRSTFPLSVFMSYLDLAEIYQLLYAEITINVTLKEEKIWVPCCCYCQGGFTLFAPAFQLSYGSLGPT